MHNRPNDCASWVPHVEYEWYIEPAMEHYRCHKAYTPKTRAERISETVEFPPKTVHMPQMSSMDATYNATQDIIYAIHDPEYASTLVKLGHGHKESLKTLADIFRKSNPPAVPPVVPVR